MEDSALELQRGQHVRFSFDKGGGVFYGHEWVNHYSLALIRVLKSFHRLNAARRAIWD